MTTAPITGPGASAETPAQGTTMADSEATIAFRQRIARIDREAEEHAAARQHAKGKRTARERITVTAAADPLRITEDFFDDVCGRAPDPSERGVLRSAYESALASARSER